MSEQVRRAPCCLDPNDERRFLAAVLSVRRGTGSALLFTTGGIHITLNGRPLGGILDRQFAELMLATFIGPQPPTPRLKRGYTVSGTDTPSSGVARPIPVPSGRCCGNGGAEASNAVRPKQQSHGSGRGFESHKIAGRSYARLPDRGRQCVRNRAVVDQHMAGNRLTRSSGVQRVPPLRRRNRPQGNVNRPQRPVGRLRRGRWRAEIRPIRPEL
jgi:hypothetical protein